MCNRVIFPELPKKKNCKEVTDVPRRLTGPSLPYVSPHMRVQALVCAGVHACVRIHVLFTIFGYLV